MKADIILKIRNYKVLGKHSMLILTEGEVFTETSYSKA